MTKKRIKHSGQDNNWLFSGGGKKSPGMEGYIPPIPAFTRYDRMNDEEIDRKLAQPDPPGCERERD